MSRKRVLLVENEDGQRNAVHRALEHRRFQVYSAANAATARQLVEQHKEPFDVVVLDMRLDDPDDPNVTGANLGIEFRKRKEWQDWPAEFLINSAYGDREYYQLALELGAAAYLEKNAESDLKSVIRHVRALALRRALSVERRDALATIDAIAKSSWDQREAVRRFCNEVLRAELVDSLGAPFLLLWTDPTGTYGYGNQSDLPAGPHKAYETVQALTQGTTGMSDPLVFKPSLLQKPIPPEEVAILSSLGDAAFIPLLTEADFHLSLGILPEPQSSQSLADDPRSLASVLAEFFRPAVLKHLLTLTTKWAELHAHRLAVLTATSQLCLYIGQEQLSALEEARVTGEIAETGPSLQELQLLAEDLREAGEVLGELARQEAAPAGAPEPASVPLRSVLSMRTIAESAWSQTSRMLDSDAPQIFRLDGDCHVRGRRDYLEIATSRVLQWFLQRLRTEAPAGQSPSILITCRETEGGAEVLFEDRSRRLPARLRKHLFVPFSQAVSLPLDGRDLRGPGLHLPLYMAKALVELGNGGLLEDCTPKDGEVGHRLVMRFPPRSPADVISATPH